MTRRGDSDDGEDGRTLADLAELYRHYAAWLGRALRKRFGTDRAEDLVQETYLRMGRYQEKAAIRYPRALLMRVAMNVANDEARRSGRRIAASAVAFEDLAPGLEPHYAPEQAESVLLKQVILAMPDTYRSVFLMSRFAGLSYEQIAVRLDISVKTVEWRMSKALAHCARELGN
jgi:RNA polymerase sigma factor (sigma-70 family)